jgi:hypothetical protein
VSEVLSSQVSLIVGIDLIIIIEGLGHFYIGVASLLISLVDVSLLEESVLFFPVHALPVHPIALISPVIEVIFLVVNGLAEVHSMLILILAYAVALAVTVVHEVPHLLNALVYFVIQHITLDCPAGYLIILFLLMLRLLLI